MRTATPLATWRLMRERGPAATSGVDLDALVHGPWVHHDGVGAARSQPLLGESPARSVGSLGRCAGALEPLALDAQRHDRGRVTQRGVHVGRHGETPVPRQCPCPRLEAAQEDRRAR